MVQLPSAHGTQKLLIWGQGDEFRSGVDRVVAKLPQAHEVQLCRVVAKLPQAHEVRV
jgi:hypothetical protein